MGRDAATAAPAEARGWDADTPAIATAVLQAVGTALPVDDAKIVDRPHDREVDLRGSMRGFPLKVTLDYTGHCRDLTLKYANTGLRFIDLEYNPALPDQLPDVEPWEPSETQVVLGPKVFVEGSDAELEATDFRALPAALQAHVLGELVRLRIRYFRSRPDELDITMHDDVRDVADPVPWLVDTLRLALEVTAGRRAVTPVAAVAEQASRSQAIADAATTLAEAIQAQLVGATIVVRDEDACIDVRWTEGIVPVRIVLDVDFDDIDLQVRATGVAGSFDLESDFDGAPLTRADGDVWNAAARQAAMLRKVGTALVDEIVASMEELSIDHVSLHDEQLDATVGEISTTRDGGAAAIRMTKLLARVAAQLGARAF